MREPVLSTRSPRRIGVVDYSFRELDDPSEADYELPALENTLSYHANAVPLFTNVANPRTFYGARFFNQAVPLIDAEAPLVRSALPGNTKRSFDDLLGDMSGNVRASRPGTVSSITDDEIIIKTDDGEEDRYDIVQNFPFNRITGLTHTPRVEPGAHIDAGSLLARSNYTTDDGTLALGRNLRTAVIPFKGHSMDDAIVMSESAAQKLTSEHLITEAMDADGGVKIGKNHYTSLFPSKFKRSQLEDIGDDGVAKPGTILEEGDPIILATRPKTVSSINSALGNLSKVTRQARSNASLIWDHEHPGEVVDVAKTKKGYKVNVKAAFPMQEGDKGALRAGQKFTVSLILPDEEMPTDIDGNPMELLLNPQGIPSRVNPATPMEIILGKVAERMGKPINVPSVTDPDNPRQNYINELLEKAGIEDTEEVLIDPQTGKPLAGTVLTGNAYTMKLHHMAEKKLSGRGASAGYTIDDQPAKGSGESAQAKRLSGLERMAMMSSGAYANLREGSTLLGARNDEYWRSLRKGENPRPAGTPMVWEKFLALLEGAGMYAQNLGDGRLRLGPMTDAELSRRNPITITKPDTLNMRNMQPVEGGLFTPEMNIGGKWGAIDLPKPMPNPAYETSIRTLLDLSKKDFEAVLAGQKSL